MLGQFVSRIWGTTLGCFLTLVMVNGSASAESEANQLTEAEKRGGWKLLFDGQTAKGWRNFKQDGLKSGWVVKDGSLVLSERSKSDTLQIRDLVTDKKYGNFELSIDYKISQQGNSGILFHVLEDVRKPAFSGPEVQLYDNQGGPGTQKSGWLYGLYQPVLPQWVIRGADNVGLELPEDVDATRPAGQWNNLYLRVSATQSEVCLNGIHYFHFRKGDDDWNQRVAKSKFAQYPGFGKASEGHICLQDHGDEVAFRNVKIRELPIDDMVPDPIDGELKLTVEPAFPTIDWEDWDGVDERGRLQQLRPIEITDAGDGSGRLFVATQDGMIHCFSEDPQVTQTNLFLDLRDKVWDFKKGNELGLLGLAFPADYETSGHFYVYYSSHENQLLSVVSRFSVSADDPNRADPNSEEIILEVDEPFANHNGGAIGFGPEDYLYIALGDGGLRNDPYSNGQNLETWLGSILRIDVKNKSGGKNYSIPSDNPFVNTLNAKPEIFAFGFRNPWRMAFDSKTGTCWLADVGQDLWEEINILQSGGNYGWSVREGSHPFGNEVGDSTVPTIEPIWEYDHRQGRSITGGMVYRGDRLPELQGAYLYADYALGKIWALFYDEKTGKVIKNMRVPSRKIPVLCFGQGESGEAYYSVGTANGQSIYRFVKP